jgi:hypothetical protein
VVVIAVVVVVVVVVIMYFKCFEFENEFSNLAS